MRKWVIQELDNNIVEQIEKEYDLNKFVSKIVASKKNNGCDISYILDNDCNFSNPFSIKDIDKAVARIYDAIENEEKILIYGDYDADGVTSTALLYNYLKNIGAYVTYFIPHREENGYGLTIGGVKLAIEDGVNLIITVDNGITAIDGVKYCNENNIDVIITDHHQPLKTLPQAYCIVNPHRVDCDSEFKFYSGVGVVFKLICAMEDNDCDMILGEYSDLVTIGTISDIMPLVLENRKIVKYGLNNFLNSNNEGVLSLVNNLSLNEKNSIDESDIGFKIAPIINSAGRLDYAKSALELLICEDAEFCDQKAKELILLNDSRKEIEKSDLQKINNYLSDNPNLLNERVLVIVIDGLNQGTIGILASKLTNKYLKPTFIITNDNKTGFYKGSSRSIGDYNLHKSLVYCSDFLEFFGGHKLAAGLTLKKENIEKVRNLLNEYYKNTIKISNDISLNINLVVNIKDMNISNIESLSVLSPFGKNNEQPVFMFKGVSIDDIKSMGDGSHSKLKVFDNNNDSIFINCFNLNKDSFSYSIKDVVDIAFLASINEYKGVRKVSLTFLDIRVNDLNDDIFSEEQYIYKIKLNEEFSKDEIDTILPNRDDVAKVYLLIKNSPSITNNIQKIYYNVGNGSICYSKIIICIRILIQHNIIKALKSNGQIYYMVNEQCSNKVNIMDCDIIKNLLNKGRVK